MQFLSWYSDAGKIETESPKNTVSVDKAIGAPFFAMFSVDLAEGQDFFVVGEGT